MYHTITKEVMYINITFNQIDNRQMIKNPDIIESNSLAY